MLTVGRQQCVVILGLIVLLHNVQVGHLISAEVMGPEDKDMAIDQVPQVTAHLVKGILAFNSTNSYTIPHARLPDLSPEGAAFTVMMALFLVRAPESGFRGVFWKGTNNSHRTPSMWITSPEPKLTFRVSTMLAEEAWGTSASALPVGEWVHVAMVSRGDGLLLLYINGNLDSAMALAAPPLANDGPLWLGRDKSQPGMEGLMASFYFSNGFTSMYDVQEAADVALETLPRFGRIGNPVHAPAEWSVARRVLEFADGVNRPEKEEGRVEGPGGASVSDLQDGALGDANVTVVSDTATWGGEWGKAAAMHRNRLWLVPDLHIAGHLGRVELESLTNKVLDLLELIEPALANLALERQQEKLHKEAERVARLLFPVNDQFCEAKPIEHAATNDTRDEDDSESRTSFADDSVTGAEAVGSSAPANVVKDAWGDRVADVTPRRGWWEEASTGPMCAVDGDDGSEHHQYQAPGHGTHQEGASPPGGGQPTIREADVVAEAARQMQAEAEQVGTTGSRSTSNRNTFDGNMARAFSLLRHAADRGHPESLSTLGFMMAGGFGGVDRDDEGAVFHYLQAAAHGNIQANMALGYRHIHGYDVPKSCEVALFYMKTAADVAYDIYNSPGGQTRLENVRLTESLSMVREDHKGLDDKENAYLLNAVTLRDPDAAALLANRYYWGSHGLEQNHPEAFRLYDQARRANNMQGTIGAAKMLLKGEGVPKNLTLSLEYLNHAASNGNKEALNGLGFMYYNGNPMEKNLTKALEYFQRSAALGSTDGMVNVGVMLWNGLGAPVDLVQAHSMFMQGAAKGHFGCIYHAAVIESHGYPGIPRNCHRAFNYFSAVAQVGPWGRVLQAGLKAYLAGNKAASSWHYAKGAELGYTTALYNIAWLHRAVLADARVYHGDQFALELDEPQSGLVFQHSDLDAISAAPDGIENAVKQTERIQRWRARSAVKSLYRRIMSESGNVGDFSWASVQLAETFYYGASHGGSIPDKELAAEYYERAGSHGDAQGLFNVGMMYMLGDGVQRDLERAHTFLSTAHNHYQTPFATYIVLAYIRWLNYWAVVVRYLEWAATIGSREWTKGTVFDSGAALLLDPPSNRESRDDASNSSFPNWIASAGSFSWEDILLLGTIVALLVITILRRRRHWTTWD